MQAIGEETAIVWAQQLGLAISPLFGASSTAPDGAHFALLDGRRASFACSIADTTSIRPEDSRNWQWSADLANHVLVTKNEVRVRSGRESETRRFSRSSVENRLADFFAFLESSQSRGLPDIVPFLIDEFLQLWSVMHPDRTQGHVALAAFLLALEAAGEPAPSIFGDHSWRVQRGRDLELDFSTLDFLENLSGDVIARAEKIQARAPLGLKVVPSLVLRHTGGRLFQEAHAYIESAQYDLFGENLVSTVPTFSPTGAYFTPLALARSLAESALSRWDILPEELVIADFACGSGIFLTEALRVLERRAYKGTVRLIGRDISAEAITMANVAVAIAKHDLAGIHVIQDIVQADVLRMDNWPPADVVLMNPPFRSWEQMRAHERDWVRSAISSVAQGRPDLSVGFIERALSALKPSGVLATLLPAGVLASERLAKWRNSILERASPTLIAVLGEHGLFRRATVNVALFVLHEGQRLHSGQVHKLDIAWASPESGAASDALRAIRRLQTLPTEMLSHVSEPSNASWNVTQTSIEAWSERPTWLPGPGVLGPLLESLRREIPTCVEDLFRVHQGIRTGDNEVFLLPAFIIERFRSSERKYFRPAVDTASFNDGIIQIESHLFVPDPDWSTEEDVMKAVPEYFREFLNPAAERLKKRRGIKPDRWWELTRVRGWSFAGKPRLVSKRFGLYPAFARDFGGKLAVVQANAWVPAGALVEEQGSDEVRNLLTAYWWLLNSRVAVALFKEYCPNVAGGQLDLEKKYVRRVPLPNLVLRTRSDVNLQALALSIREKNGESLPSIAERDAFAAAAFGTTISDWPLTRD